MIHGYSVRLICFSKITSSTTTTPNVKRSFTLVHFRNDRSRSEPRRQYVTLSVGAFDGWVYSRLWRYSQHVLPLTSLDTCVDHLTSKIYTDDSTIEGACRFKLSPTAAVPLNMPPYPPQWISSQDEFSGLAKMKSAIM